MSVRPVARVLESKPTMEGAGVKLRRAFGFGDTTEFDPFLLFDDFRNERSAGLPCRISRGIRIAASKRSPTCSRARSSTATASAIAAAWGRRRAVDDCGTRHPAPGNAARRRGRPHARLSALGEPAGVAEDDGAAVSGHPCEGHPGSHRRRRHACARDLRRVLGPARTGRWRGRRPSVSRCIRPARQTGPAAGRPREPCVCVRVRGRRQVPRRLAAARRAERNQRRSGCGERQRDRQSIARPVRPRRRSRRAGRRRRAYGFS